jgi:hypothetical protein
MATIGRVVVRPITKTTISAPNYTPKLNVAITDIQYVNVASRQDGDTLIYNSATGTYESQPIQNAQIDITNINGGRF